MKATTLGSLTQLSNSEFTLDGDTFTIAAPGLARALGFHAAKDVLRSIPEEEKGWELSPTPGGEQRIGYLTEAGFYRALGQRQSARIKDPDIRDRVARFQDWVYAEVLPQIRKRGGYLTPEAASPHIDKIGRDGHAEEGTPRRLRRRAAGVRAGDTAAKGRVHGRPRSGRDVPGDRGGRGDSASYRPRRRPSLLTRTVGKCANAGVGSEAPRNTKSPRVAATTGSTDSTVEELNHV